MGGPGAGDHPVRAARGPGRRAPTGLEAIASVAPAAVAALAAGGSLALEVGAGQAGAVAELMLDLGFGQVEGRQDLAGIPRVVLGRMGSG